MNIVATLIERIEDRLTETKNPCKSYATEARAEGATERMAKEVAAYHGADRPARYVVVYVESWGRWIGAVDLTELLSRPDTGGGYVFFCADKGFYTF